MYHVTWVRVIKPMVSFWSFGDGPAPLFWIIPMLLPSFGTGYVDHWTMSFALGTYRRIDLHLGFHFHVWSTHRGVGRGLGLIFFIKNPSETTNPLFDRMILCFFFAKILLNHNLQLETFYMICNWKPFESC